MFRSGVKEKLIALADKMFKPVDNDFAVGDLVLVKNFVRSNEDKSTKFQNRFIGPFRIGDNSNKASPLLVNLDGSAYDTVSVKNLKKYVSSEFPFNRAALVPSNFDDSGDGPSEEFTPDDDPSETATDPPETENLGQNAQSDSPAIPAPRRSSRQSKRVKENIIYLKKMNSILHLPKRASIYLSILLYTTK